MHDLSTNKTKPNGRLNRDLSGRQAVGRRDGWWVFSAAGRMIEIKMGWKSWRFVRGSREKYQIRDGRPGTEQG